MDEPSYEMSKVADFEEVGPGRPRKVVRLRSSRVEARVARHREANEEHANRDPVVLAARAGDSVNTLHVARLELAREAAGLLFARLHAIPGSRELGRLSTRRISALREIAALTMAIARVDSGNPSPATMAKIIESLLETVNQAAREVLPEPDARRLAIAWQHRLKAGLEGLRTAAPSDREPSLFASLVEALAGTAASALSEPQSPAASVSQ